jgi:hypothetical protein
MKTGRLLKFNRGGTAIHAYLYVDGTTYKAAVYVRARDAPDSKRPFFESSQPSLQALEAEVRAWVDAHYPARSRA